MKRWKKEIRKAAERIAAAAVTIAKDKGAREALKKRLGRDTVVFLAGVLCGVLWLRSVDVRSEGAAAQCGDDPLISHGEAVTASPQGEAKESREEAKESREEAEEIARMLYGMRKNSERDLRAVCWVVFNRVESPLYPDTIEEVIAQPMQWVGYYPENPATKALTALAEEELEKWERGESGPISPETLWFNWSSEGIAFREEF